MAAPRLCSNCKTPGHNSRTCKEPKVEKAASDGGIVASVAPAAPVKVEPVKVELDNSGGPSIIPWEVRFSAFAHFDGKRYLVSGSRRMEVSEEDTFSDVPALLGL